MRELYQSVKGGRILTKRDLVKYVERKGQEAREKASQHKKEIIAQAQEQIYEDIGVNAFVKEVVPMYKAISDKYDDFIERIDKIDHIRFSEFYYAHGYNELHRHLTSVYTFKEAITGAISINTEEYNTIVKEANAEVMKVISTYDTVLMTVKNLPTAKDGIEYLKKLGFDTSEIEPVKKEKQLPATTNINIDIKYLLLEENQHEE